MEDTQQKFGMSNSEKASGSSGGGEGPGEKHVGLIGILLLAIYLVVAVSLCIYALVVLWPTPVPAGPPNENAPAPITVLFWTFKIYDEVRLLLIVSFAGALGSLVHAVRSYYWYIGNRELVRSWIAKYLMQPFAGTALAVVFYLVIRGGFFSPQAGFRETSPFGFAALAALVGMFSEQAVLKLKDVAETILAKPKPGEDAKPQDSES
jgi:hypothetical protein